MLLLSMGTEEPSGGILLRRPQNWIPTNAAQQHQAHPRVLLLEPSLEINQLVCSLAQVTNYRQAFPWLLFRPVHQTAVTRKVLEKEKPSQTRSWRCLCFRLSFWASLLAWISDREVGVLQEGVLNKWLLIRPPGCTLILATRGDGDAGEVTKPKRRQWHGAKGVGSHGGAFAPCFPADCAIGLGTINPGTGWCFTHVGTHCVAHELRGGSCRAISPIPSTGGHKRAAS